MRYYFEGIEDLIEYPDGVVPIRTKIVKPFPTCETCPIWKTACRRVTLDERGFKKRQSLDTMDTWTDPDDFCKDHPDFTKGKSEVTNGKDM